MNYCGKWVNCYSWLSLTTLDLYWGFDGGGANSVSVFGPVDALFKKTVQFAVYFFQGALESVPGTH